MKLRPTMLLASGLAATLIPSSPALATLRIATYNIDVSDTDAIVAPPEIYPILQAMGALQLAGNAQPIDVLTLTELDSIPSRTLIPMVDALNAIYGPGTYAYDPYVGKVSSVGHANGPSGVIYNTKTVQLLAHLGGFTRVSGTYAPRESIRYQFRPLGYGSDADFYVYVDHAKASANTAGTTDNETRRLYEAQDVRANADALGPSAHILYTGDYNLHYASAEFSYQYMTQTAGSGKMIDVVNPANNFTNTAAYQGIETESAQSLFGRYDLVLPNQAAVDQPGLQYVPGTTTVVGNNGTTARGTATNLPSNTALSQFPNRQELLNDLYSVSDHLPVLADYRLVGVTPQWLAWTGGTGNWSTARQWHAGVTPNAPATEARIDNSLSSTASVVTLDQNATVKDLLINSGDALLISAGKTLTLAGPTTSVLSGTLTNAGGTLAASAPLINAGAFTQSATGTLSASSFANTGTVTLNGAQQWADNSTFTNNGGAATFNSDAGSPTSSPLTLNAPAGSIVFNASQHLLTLSLSNNAQATLPSTGPAAPTTLTLKNLSLSGSATLDLADNSLSLIYTLGSPIDQIRSYLRTGALFSSTANADPQHLLALAYTDTGSAITTQLTPYGDANLDGTVNADDYALLDRSAAQHLPLAHWTDGDFNYDGAVNQQDYLLIDATYLQQQGGTPSPAFLAQRQSQFGADYVNALLTSVPEPSSLLAACGLAFPLTRRRRK